MATHRVRMLIGLMIVGAAAALVATPQRPAVPDDRAAVLDFERRINDYVALHRTLEGGVPPVLVSKDMAVVRAAMEALAARIRFARKDARPGDIFTDDIAAMVRRRIVRSLPPEEMADILSENDEHAAGVVGIARVNGPWPEGMPLNYVPPQLLAALPPLPAELEYRIIGRTLVLWDHHANLIVDFLPAAFTT